MSLSIVILALIIGIFLGLIGGGGSILTVPILVYIGGISPVIATGYSLFIVGSTSLVGALINFKNKLVHLPTAILFSIPSFISVYTIRRYILPIIPDKIITIGDYTLSKNIFIMLLFAIIMVFAALRMINSNEKENLNDDISQIKFNYPFILLQGFIVGILAGAVGAGGGFLIIPALVMFARLPMRLAIGTSLLIIAINSLIGFMGDLQIFKEAPDWNFLLMFSGIAISGIVIGVFAGKKIAPEKLKMFFGWFVLIMAVYILSKELIFPNVHL